MNSSRVYTKIRDTFISSDTQKKNPMNSDNVENECVVTCTTTPTSVYVTPTTTTITTLSAKWKNKKKETDNNGTKTNI